MLTPGRNERRNRKRGGDVTVERGISGNCAMARHFALRRQVISRLTPLRGLSHSVRGVISLNGIYRPWGYGLARREACFHVALDCFAGHTGELRPAEGSNLATNKRKNQATGEPRRRQAR